MLTAETPGADIEALSLPSKNYRSLLDIRQPAPPGMTLGVTYIITKLGYFPTEFTFSCQDFAPFTNDVFSDKMLTKIIPQPSQRSKSKGHEFIY